MDKYPGGDREKSNEAYDIVAEIDRRVKNYTDSILHLLGSTSSRLSELEIRVTSKLSELEYRTKYLENSVNDLRLAVGNSTSGTEGKLKQLENIMREIQNQVQKLQGNQGITETQLKISKLQIPGDEYRPLLRPSQAESELHQAPSPQPASAPHEQSPPYLYPPTIQHPPPGEPPSSMWPSYQLPSQPPSPYPPQHHGYQPPSEEVAFHQQPAPIPYPASWSQASYVPRTDAYDTGKSRHDLTGMSYKEPPVFLPPPPPTTTTTTTNLSPIHAQNPSPHSAAQTSQTVQTGQTSAQGN